MTEPTRQAQELQEKHDGRKVAAERGEPFTVEEIKVDGKKTALIRAHGPGDFMHLLDTTANGDSWTYGKDGDLGTLDQRLKAGKAYPGTLEAFNTLSKAIQPAVEKATAAAPTARRERRFREFGDELDVNRWLAGDDNPWSVRQRGARRGRYVIGLQQGISSDMSDRVIATIATIATATAHALDKLGHAIEVRGVQNMTAGMGTWESKCKWRPGVVIVDMPLKLTGQTLDPEALLSMGGPGFFREHIFGMFSHILGFHRQGGYGTPKPPTQETRRALGVDIWIGTGWKRNGLETLERENVLDGLLPTIWAEAKKALGS